MDWKTEKKESYMQMSPLLPEQSRDFEVLQIVITSKISVEIILLNHCLFKEMSIKLLLGVYCKNGFYFCLQINFLHLGYRYGHIFMDGSIFKMLSVWF